jgi:hypothetical protein
MEPLCEYQSRRAEWLAKQTLFGRQFVLIGNWRLGLSGCGVWSATLYNRC